MLAFLVNLLGGDTFYAHSICLTNDPMMIWAYVASDLTIWLSYMTISITLLLYLSKKLHNVVRLSYNLFAAFIMLCGMTHLTDTMVLFSGLYRLDLMVRIATAVVSAGTALQMMSQLYHHYRYARS